MTSFAPLDHILCPDQLQSCTGHLLRVISGTSRFNRISMRKALCIQSSTAEAIRPMPIQGFVYEVAIRGWHQALVHVDVDKGNSPAVCFSL